MRASAFVFSILSAIYGLGVLVLYLQATVLAGGGLPDVFGPLASTLGDGPVAQIVLALFFLLPIVNIVGAGITLQFLWPGVLLTLVAAVGWVFVGLLLGFDLSVNQINVVPLILCALAAVLSFLGGFESERVASWIAGIVALLTAGLLGFLIFDYYRADSMFFGETTQIVPTVEVPAADDPATTEPELPEEPEAADDDSGPVINQPFRPASGGAVPN